jgi:(1->4)-alpha-D-glucan 1-alpha-D-glucosylmutase
MMPPGPPLATYRLQLNPCFGFRDAAAIVPYLAALGVSHLYASPFLKARSGSTHGYDVVDHNALNPELGDEAAFGHLCEVLRESNLGLILDFVPNHMGVHHADNPWWLDVLEWGPKSPYARSFDIDWNTLAGHAGGGLLIPVLGTSYATALERGDIELRYDAAEGSFSAWYYEHRLPIDPTRYAEILQKVVTEAGADEQPAGRELLALAARYRGPHNPPRSQAPMLKTELAAIAGGEEIIEGGLRAYRASADMPGAGLALDHLLERQHYRLAYWRLSLTEINYRRFFDINTLAGLRIEDRPTFDAVHALVCRLIAAGRLQGLRIDHVDGIHDPHQYFRRLQRLIDTHKRSDASGFYLVIEKILARGERLPRFAGVAGTTGYEWLNLISRVLIDDRGLSVVEQAWREASGDERCFDEILIEAKRRVLTNVLASEFTVLVRLLARIAAGHYTTRDYSGERLRLAFELFVLHFPIYRTYITPSGPSREDRAVIMKAIDAARADWFGTDADILDFLRDVLTLDLIAPGRSGHSIARVRRFAFKVQQFTSPMMAKSLEDTAFYRYHRLLALNEVGADPAAGGISVGQFHEDMQQRATRWPHGLTATATHDTKRGEDGRARLIALTELADAWSQSVRDWRQINSGLTDSAGPLRIPSPGHEYMLYQALLGAWPLAGIDASFVERMQAYAVKAAREGKQQTSWTVPNERYEEGLRRFVHGLLDPQRSDAFIESFDAFARRLALLGALKSLTQLVLKTAGPGVPDIYQGTEFWDLSLVDPDNRRAVDFTARASALESLAQTNWRTLAATWADGRIKLALTRRLLDLRRQFPDVFADGLYRPLEVAGADSDEILAFARLSGRTAVIVVAGRLFGRVTEGGRHWPSGQAWKGAVMLEGFSDIGDLFAAGKKFSGPALSVSELFDAMPVAILQAQSTGMGAPRARAAVCSGKSETGSGGGPVERDGAIGDRKPAGSTRPRVGVEARSGNARAG